MQIGATPEESGEIAGTETKQDYLSENIENFEIFYTQSLADNFPDFKSKMRSMLKDVRKALPDHVYNVMLKTKGIILNESMYYDGVKVESPDIYFLTWSEDPKKLECIEITKYGDWSTRYVTFTPAILIHELAHAYMHFRLSEIEPIV